LPCCGICLFSSATALNRDLFIAWIEGFAIFLGVFVVATVGSWNDWQKEKQFLKLQAENEKENVVCSI
jgi:hypothetical protein